MAIFFFFFFFFGHNLHDVVIVVNEIKKFIISEYCLNDYVFVK